MKNRNIPTILSLLKIEIHTEHYARIRHIDEEDYTSVRKKTKEILAQQGIQASEDYLDAGIVGLKQYYVLALLDPANGHAVSTEIDAFWHAHMLFSEQYIKFCEEVVGGYMHHTPLDRDEKDQIENLRTLYEYTIEVLEKIFGNSTEERVWPKVVSDLRLICFHRRDSYLPRLNQIRLFSPTIRGDVWAFV